MSYYVPEPAKNRVKVNVAARIHFFHMRESQNCEDTLMDMPFVYAFYVIVNMSDIHVMKSVLF